MSQQPCLAVPKKRKRKDGDDHNDNNGFDHLDQLDAGEYLRRVVEEAKALPQVFASNTSHVVKKHHHEKKHTCIGGLVESMSYLTSQRVALHPPPTPQHAATREWVDMALYNFSQLRSYLEQCQLHGVGGKGTNRLPLPALKDRPGWHVFCVGQSEAQGNSNEYFGDDDSADDKVPSDNEASSEVSLVEPWKHQLPPGGYTPTVSLLLQMDQVMTRRVLSHLIHYVTEGWTVSTKQRVAWIYSLLARLERPIHREDAALLYKLLKHLTFTRATISAKNVTEQEAVSQLARLNLLISVIGVYFEQGGGYTALMEAH